MSRTFVVAEQGSDRNPGTEGRPLRTIQKAASLMKAGDVCLIREGTYRETVRPVNSGAPDAPITFKAYPGEKATVSGCDLIEAPWSAHEGQIYKAACAKQFIQLFVDGVMMNEARWPNMAVHDFFNPANRARMDDGDTQHIVDTDLPPGDWTGAVVNVLPAWEWIIFTRRVAKYSPGKSLTFDQPSPRAGEHNPKHPDSISDPETCYRPRKGNPYFLFGALAGLDCPAEWYLDEKAGTVYLWTAEGDSPSEHRVEVKQRGYAFDLSTQSHIRIEDLNIFAAAINMEGSYCVADGITMLYPNHFREQPIIHHWPLGTPNIMAGHHNEWKNSHIAYSACDGIKVHGDGHAVTNCLIHDVGYTGVYAACVNTHSVGGIDTTHSEDGIDTTHCRITRNTMYDSGRFIIMHHGMHNSEVSYNHMMRPGRMTSDSGVNYCHSPWSKDTVFAYNWVHDNLTAAGSALYLDESTKPHDLHHNVVWHAAFGFQMNVNSNHLLPKPDTRFYNNTIDFSHNPEGYSACVTNNADNLKVINNILNPSRGGELWRRDLWDFWIVRDWWREAHPEKPANGLACVNETDENNLTCPLDPFFRLPENSPAVDGGKELPPFTDGYAGKAPDVGAYERGGPYWLPGSTLDPKPIFSYLPGAPCPIERTEPAAAATGVPTSLSQIVVTFVPRMSAASFAEATISGGLRFGPAQGDGTPEIRLPIIGPLKKNTTYTVTIPTAVRPVEGMKILEKDFSFSFTVGS